MLVLRVGVRCHAVLLDRSHETKTVKRPHAHIGVSGDVVVVLGWFGSLTHEIFLIMWRSESLYCNHVWSGLGMGLCMSRVGTASDDKI